MAWLPALLAIALSALVFTFHEFDAFLWLSFAIALWLVLMCVRDWLDKVITARQSLWQRACKLPRHYYGMQLAHIGVAVSLIGVIFVSMNSTETIVRMAPGDRVTVADYDFEFLGTRHVEGPNYTADTGVINVFKDGKNIAQMLPQKRLYQARQQMMTEAALNPGFTRDLYISLGERLEDGAWGVRIYVKSFVRWIWLGGLLMMAGGLLAAWDKRYRRKTGD